MCSWRPLSNPRRTSGVGARLPDHRGGVASHRQARAVAGRAHRGLPAPHRNAGQPARQLRDRHCRAGGSGGKGGGSGDHGLRTAESPARHPLLPERHLRHRGHPHDSHVQVAGGQCPGAGFPLPRKACGRRRRAFGQERHVGVRPWWPVMGHPFPAGAQSVGSHLLARRLLVGLRRGGRSGICAGDAGQRHRRLDPQPGCGLRHRRPEADLRVGQPARRTAELF